MYFFPSYVTYEERSGSVYISSKLLQNEIKISLQRAGAQR